MRLLDSFLSLRLAENRGLIPIAGPRVADAIGWTLFHSLWEGIAIAAALAALLAFLRSPRARYAAGCFALFAILTAFTITLIHFLPEQGERARAAIKTALPPWRELANAAEKSQMPDLASVIPWLAPFWLAGVCLFYLRYSASWLSSHRLRRRGICRVPEIWQRSVARLATELRVSRPVVLLESLLTDTPLVLGHFRPIILVPLGFLAGLPPDQLEAILLHELAHIGRSDYLVNVCQRLVEGLLFYHPAVWWISRIVRVEREHCCDDVVVALRGDAHGYAVALTALEQNRNENAWAGHQTAVAATGGNLMKRIKRLLYPKNPGGAWAPALAAITLLAGTAVAIGAWRVTPNTSPAAEQTANTDNPWQKWLNEDVVYIISGEERAAFERLTTDEERQHFVEQFWARRDPTPGTPENEFKEEHYRRLAYANQHFASSQAGWKTDRGHMYIVYGPPDEIDAHPSGTAKISHAFESWRYRHVDGLGDNLFFTFVDQTGRGDYCLAPSSAQ